MLMNYDIRKNRDGVEMQKAGSEIVERFPSHEAARQALVRRHNQPIGLIYSDAGAEDDHTWWFYCFEAEG